MRASLILTCLVAASALEVPLLHAFVFHPAWGLKEQQANDLLVQYLSWAGVPLMAAMLVVLGAAIWRRPLQRATRPLIFVAAVGPLLAFIALRQLSHGALGLLAIGFLLQCAGVLYGGFRLRNAIAT